MSKLLIKSCQIIVLAQTLPTRARFGGNDPPPGNLQKALEKHLPSKLAGGRYFQSFINVWGGIDRQNILLRPNFPGPPNQDNS